MGLDWLASFLFKGGITGLQRFDGQLVHAEHSRKLNKIAFTFSVVDI